MHTVLLGFSTALPQASGKNICAGIMGTHFSSLDDVLEEDMHHWYTKFMRESPSGLITLFELKTILEMNGMTEEASSYVDQVFYTFDMDGVWISSRLLKENNQNRPLYGDKSSTAGVTSSVRLTLAVLDHKYLVNISTKLKLKCKMMPFLI